MNIFHNSDPFLLQSCRDVATSALQSVCKTHATLSEEHLISPLLMELEANPNRAWLLASLSSIPSQAAFILPSLVSVLQHLLANSSSHCETASLNWEPISSAFLDVIRNNAESVPLTPTLVDALVLLSHQAANAHWQCCNAQVRSLIRDISSSLSHNARHATDRFVDWDHLYREFVIDERDRWVHNLEGLLGS